MQLKFLKILLEAQDEPAKIRALAWSPNNQKLAVATSERTVILYDENGVKRNKFSLKPVDSKYGKKSFAVTGIAFSPDSTKIAVGQSDNIVYVYKIGEDWNDKKVICNKFPSSAAITALTWLSEGPLVFGTADGKLRQGNQKSNKAVTLYATDSFVTSLATNSRGTGFLSGHADGTIVRYYAIEDVSPEPQGRILTHTVPPYALAWALNHIIVGGCDQKIVIYTKDGRPSRIFDYTREQEKEFTIACCSPSGQSVAVGSFNRIRLFCWSPAKGIWEESPPKEIKNMYTVTALAWRKDGSRVACGTLCQSVFLLETVLKRTIWKNKFEMTYVGPSQVLVKPLTEKGRGVVLKSQFGHEIDDVRIMGRDCYLVARTSHTLLLGDLTRNLLSEVLWPNSGRNEKFYFDNANVCLIFNVGELSLVEYGVNDILGSVRTDFMNPHLISVRLNERKGRSNEENKKMAYLLDLKTICVIDLMLNLSICQLSHDTKIDWLELNETGHILLFRDKRQRLFLLNVGTKSKETILTNCTFVQWVPGSDVVVAQSLSNLCIWYNIDTPSNISVIPIKGEVTDVVRGENTTEVIVQEGLVQLGYQLDEGLLKFGTAVHDNDFGRAILFLESLEESRPETEGMWRNLATIALEKQNLKIAERCFAAMGDVSKTFYLNETSAIGQKFAEENETHIMACPEIWTRLAILNKDFPTAEQIYLEQGQVEAALQMYQDFHRWDEAFKLADRINYPNKNQLEETYTLWLISTGQEERLAEIKEKNGDYNEAIDLYLKGKRPVRAAKLLLSYSFLSHDEGIISRVVLALKQSDQYEHAGDLYDKLNNPNKALECYKTGKCFGKAVELSRRICPNEIVSLEAEWGDYLVESKQLDAAINHFIEAGKTLKAVEAAVAARQWKKAVQIIQVVDDTKQVQHLFEKIGTHFVQVKDYSTAENMLLKAGMVREVIDMYNRAGLWEKGYSVASRYLSADEVAILYANTGEALEKSGKLRDAEQVYQAIGEIDRAISMYKHYRQFDDMLRLVQKHSTDHLGATLVQLGQELENSRQWSTAENYYVRAGEWSQAVAMYKKVDMWEDAFRVAKSNGSDAEISTAVDWAKKLGGGEAAARLLNRLDLLAKCVDYACTNDEFDLALSIAKVTQPDKLPELHLKYALALEEDGKFSEAERHFIAGNKQREAILMYMNLHDWEKAEKLAHQYDTEALPEIFTTHAAYSLQEGDFAAVESYLLRAQRPDLLIENFQKSGMWEDAFRVCREYIPSKLNSLQALYNKEVHSSGGDPLSLARNYERMGQYKDAIRYYIRWSEESENVNMGTRAMLKAAELTIKFVDADEGTSIAKSLGPRLAEVGEYNAAANLYLYADLNKDAVDVYINAEDWSRAKKMAADLNPQLEHYVDEKYKGHLTSIEDFDQLVDVDGVAALDVLYRQGNWKQLFEKAKMFTPQILHKYVALQANLFINKDDVFAALKLYNEFDAPAISTNYKIYKKIAYSIFEMRGRNGPENYSEWSMLRNMLYSLINHLVTSSDANTDTHEEFETLHLIAHYYASRCAFRSSPSMLGLAMKVSFALLRYTDIIPADEAFYEAGLDAKEMNRENEAFIFWNYYLDIVEAIEEINSTVSIDTSDFTNTDFPQEIMLPDKQFLSSEKHEYVKNWVIQNSMAPVNKVLPLDSRNLFESSLTSLNHGEQAYLPCVVTGYPVITSRDQRPIAFSKPGKFANREDWNALKISAKANGGPIGDVHRFIEDWCGRAPLDF